MRTGWHDGRASQGWLDSVGAGSGVGREVASIDWARSELGDPAEWPLELRALVMLCLTTRFPMLVTWGPRLLMIYNDGYREMIGDKHPAALGSPMAVVWAEIWDDVGALVEEVMRTGEPTWAEHQRLVMDRHGFPEETFFTFSYSPALDRDGRPAGLVDVATETTAQILAQRRLTALGNLGEAVFSAAQVTGVCVAAAAELARWVDDIVDADVYLQVVDEPVLIASTRRFDVAPVTAAVLREVLDSGTDQVVDPAAVEVAPPRGLALALTSVGGGPRGVLFVEPRPTLAFGVEHRTFLMEVAATIGRALTTAHARAVELGEQRHINETLQRAMLQPANDHPTVAARYVPAALNLAVGGDWYDVVDLDEHRRALVVGDCVGHGLEAATAMGQLRSAARALCLEDHDPAVVLQRLDSFASSIPGAFATSVVCVIIDRLRGVVSYSSAGHPPPLVIDASGVRWLDGAGGAVLQVAPAATRAVGEVTYADGDLLVLYTDGLVERRGEVIDVGLERLATAARRWFERDAGVHAAADGVLRELLPIRGDDDVVLVAKRLVLDAPQATG